MFKKIIKGINFLFWFLFRVNHRKPIFKNISFWFWIFFPICFGGFMGSLIWMSLDFLLSSTGYNYFLEISKLPLGIMSLSLPSVGIYVVHYKSKQTSELISISKIKEYSSEKGKHKSSLIALGVSVHRLKNHLSSLDARLSKQTTSLDTLNSEFDAIHMLWSDIYKEPKYSKALSVLYHHMEEVDAFFLGIKVSLSVEKRDFFKKGMLSRVVSGLDLIHLRILHSSSHCDSFYLQEIIKIKSLYGIFDFKDEIKLEDETKLEDAYKQMQEHDKEITELEGKK